MHYASLQKLIALSAIVLLSPAQAFPAEKNLLSADQVQEAASLTLASLERVLAASDLSPEGRKKAGQWLDEQRSKIGEVVARVRGEDLRSDEALRRIGDILNLAVGRRLREVLSGGEYLSFARNFVARHGDEPDPIRDMFGQLLTAASQLDLSDLQRDELSGLCLGILSRYDALKRDVAMGIAGKAEIRQATSDFTEHLVGGLKRILSPSQYQQVEEAIQRQIGKPASQPAVPKQQA